MIRIRTLNQFYNTFNCSTLGDFFNKQLANDIEIKIHFIFPKLSSYSIHFWAMYYIVNGFSHVLDGQEFGHARVADTKPRIPLLLQRWVGIIPWVGGSSGILGCLVADGFRHIDSNRIVTIQAIGELTKPLD